MVAQFWWMEARLWVGAAKGTPTQLGRGPAVEMIALALASASIDQEQIFLRVDGAPEPMGWTEIVQAAARADFPIII